MPRRTHIVAFASALAVTAVLVNHLLHTRAEPPADTATLLMEMELDGKTVAVFDDGFAYLKQSDGTWGRFEQVFEAGYQERYYLGDGGRIYRRDPESDERVEVYRHWSDGFEQIAHVRDLFHRDDLRFTSFTLQSPKTPTVRDYVDLRTRILAGDADFVDNRLEPDDKLAQAGEQSLRCYCVPPTGEMVCSKASITTELIHFVEGDTVEFEGWFRLDGQAEFLTLVDLESSWLIKHAGIRITLNAAQHLGVELKWADKPSWKATTRVEFPQREWVHVRWRLGLSADEDGTIELWQDDTKLIDATGRTFPLPGGIYNSLEVGCSALSGDKPVTVHVDDVSIRAIDE